MAYSLALAILRRMRRPSPRAVDTFIPQRETGQALIEFVLVLPVVVLFIVVAVDFGFALDRRELVQHAVREGARMGAVGATVTEIADHTNDQSAGILSNVAVCYENDNGDSILGNTGDSVRVSGTYAYNLMIGGGAFLSTVFDPILMTPSAEARLENSVANASPNC